ncbi:MAG: TetR/AcrR family transcriptional regulator [Planctomycetaceae bacterium]
MVQIQAASRAEGRRAEILRRAASLFRRKGFHRAGMRDLAGELGIAPGALYYYFKSKDDLLHACQMLSLKRLLQSARELAGSPAPAGEKLRRLVAAHLGHILDELGGSFAHVEFHALPPPLLAEVVRGRDAYERIVRGILEEGVASGAFRALDVKLGALSLLGALNWTVVWWRPDGRHTLPEVAAEVAEIFLRGVKA